MTVSRVKTLAEDLLYRLLTTDYWPTSIGTLLATHTAERRIILMEKKDNAFDVKVSSDRTGGSEGIGLPTGGSSRSGDSQFGAQSSSGTGNTTSGGFGVTDASDLGSSSGRTPGSPTGSAAGSNLGSTSEFHECATCGERHMKGAETQGFDKILTTVGINERAIEKMRESLENLDLDGYFSQAKEYLGESATKAKQYAKDNKAIIGTALALVAVGAGVLIAANRKGNESWVTPRIDDRDIDRV